MNEMMAYTMNNQRMALFSRVVEKSGATESAARDENKPHPRFSIASITEPVEYGKNLAKSEGISGKFCWIIDN